MYVVIIGNIGVGKTSLLNRFQQRHPGECRVMEERVDDNKVLHAFYEEPIKYAFATQSYFLDEQMWSSIQLTSKEARFQIQDRSIYDTLAFSRSLLEQGKMDKNQFALFKASYRTALKLVPTPDVVLYITADPIENMARIVKRGRECEKNICTKYIESLTAQFDLLADELSADGIRLVRINNKDLDESVKQLEKELE